MSIEIIDVLKPKNNGDFPVVEAEDVAVGTVRLPDALNQKADKSELAEANAALAGKASTAEVTTATNNLQGQIDQIVISASAEAVVAPEVAQARVGYDGTEYNTLKERLDASDATKPDFLSFGYYVAQEVDETSNAVSKNTNPRTVITDGYSGFQTAVIAVEEGEKYKISGWSSNDELYFPAFYGDTDSEPIEIISVTPSSGYFTNEEITVPYLATRLCINGRSSASPAHPIVVEKLSNYDKSTEFFENYNQVRADALSALQFPSWHRAEITVVKDKLCNSNTLAISNENGFEYLIYPISTGVKYKITGWGSATGDYAPAYWSDSAFVAKIPATTDTNGFYGNFETTAPEGATKIVLNGRPNRGYNIKVDKLTADEKSNEFWEKFAEVKATAEDTASKAMFFPTWTDKEFTQTTGYLCNYKTLEPAAFYGFAYTIYPVTSGEKYKITGWGRNGGDYTPAFWSASALVQSITVENDSSDGYEVEVSVPQNATRLIINGRPNRDQNITIKKMEAQGESGEFWEDFFEIQETVENATFQPLAGKVIVNFGDSIFGNYSAPDDISSEIANITGATVYNCGFSGCRMAAHIYSGWDAFSMYRLAYSVANNDFTVQDNAIANPDWSDKPAKFATTLALLESIDFSEVDYITIAYGTNDFTGNVAIDNQNNELNTSTYKGALRYSLNQLLAAYPQIQVITCTPIYRTWNDSGGQYENDANTRLNENNNTLRDFYDAVLDVTDKYNVQVIDNFHIGMSRYNRTYYWTSPDFTHPNIKGRKLIAKHISHELY